MVDAYYFQLHYITFWKGKLYLIIKLTYASTCIMNGNIFFIIFLYLYFFSMENVR